MQSPYENRNRSEWQAITEDLIKAHPLKEQDLIDAVFAAWDGIFNTMLAGKLKIGTDIHMKPQEIGSFLHALIPYELEQRFPSDWRRDKSGDEKDIVCVANNNFSIEIKTSSNKTRIFANRSYAQDTTDAKKSKTGYYLAVNFENTTEKHQIRLIRFGWIDAKDWQGQASQSGQQAHLEAELEHLKLKTIYKLTNN
ncbi:ScaI family restriction endonuclease [bacterium]|nr:ScaI family restriction endonuclease [bacterium]